MSHRLTGHSEDVPKVKFLHSQLLLVHLRMILVMCVMYPVPLTNIANGRAHLQMLRDGGCGINVFGNIYSTPPTPHSLFYSACVCYTHKLTIAGRGAVSLGHPTVSLTKLQALCGFMSLRDSAERRCCAHYFPVTCFIVSEMRCEKIQFW